MPDEHRVFISHAGHEKQEPETQKFVDALASALLSRPDFDVFLDRNRLTPGDDWWQEICFYLGRCHSAVVVLSPRAVREDPEDQALWVPRESTVLQWRLTVDPAFKLIPVYMSGFDRSALSRGLLKESGLERIHAIQEDDPRRAVEAVVQALEKRTGSLRRTPVDVVADQIVAVLSEVKPIGIERALQNLPSAALQWTPRNDPLRAIAVRLLHMDLMDAVDFVRTRLLPYTEPEDGIGGKLFELIVPKWVDLEAAQWIARCSLPPDDKRVMVLNASRRFIAEMYVQRVTGLRLRESWPVIEAPTRYRSVEAAAVEVEWRLLETLLEARRPRLALITRARARPAQRRHLFDTLELNNKRGNPVICVVRLRPGLRGLLAKLRQEFPQLSLLVLSGERFPDPRELRELNPRLLTPSLSDVDERNVLKVCCYAVSRLHMKLYADECTR